MQERRHPKSVLFNICSILFILFIIIIYLCNYLERLYQYNNELSVYAAKTFLSKTISFGLMFTLVALIILQIYNQYQYRQLTKKECLFAASLLLLSGFLLSLFLPMGKSYEGIIIKNERNPMTVKYYYALVKDLSHIDHTEQVILKDDDLFETTTKVISGYRVKKTNYYHYLNYVGADGYTYSSMEDEAIINLAIDLSYTSTGCHIEYYPNSGVIKSINTFEKNKIPNLQIP